MRLLIVALLFAISYAQTEQCVDDSAAMQCEWQQYDLPLEDVQYCEAGWLSSPYGFNLCSHNWNSVNSTMPNDWFASHCRLTCSYCQGRTISFDSVKHFSHIRDGYSYRKLYSNFDCSYHYHRYYGDMETPLEECLGACAAWSECHYASYYLGYGGSPEVEMKRCVFHRHCSGLIETVAPPMELYEVAVSNWTMVLQQYDVFNFDMEELPICANWEVTKIYMPNEEFKWNCYNLSTANYSSMNEALEVLPAQCECMSYIPYCASVQLLGECRVNVADPRSSLAAWKLCQNRYPYLNEYSPCKSTVCDFDEEMPDTTATTINSSQDSDSNTALIIGTIIGCVCILAMICCYFAYNYYYQTTFAANEGKIASPQSHENVPYKVADSFYGPEILTAGEDILDVETLSMNTDDVNRLSTSFAGFGPGNTHRIMTDGHSSPSQWDTMEISESLYICDMYSLTRGKAIDSEDTYFIKTFTNAKSIEFLAREFSVLQNLMEHHMIIECFDQHKFANGSRGIILQSFEESLEDVINNRSESSLVQSIEYLRQISEALDFLHKQDYIYRGLRSRNCFINVGEFGETHIVLSGFELMSQPDIDESDEEKCYFHSGDDAYIGPDQLTSNARIGFAPASKENDIYSFGVLAWELLELQPIPGPTRVNEELLSRSFNYSRLFPFRHAPPNIQKEIKKCWSRIRRKRPTAEHLHHFLTSFEINDSEEPLFVEGSETKSDSLHSLSQLDSLRSLSHQDIPELGEGYSLHSLSHQDISEVGEGYITGTPAASKRINEVVMGNSTGSILGETPSPGESPRITELPKLDKAASGNGSTQSFVGEFTIAGQIMNDAPLRPKYSRPHRVKSFNS